MPIEGSFVTAVEVSGCKKVNKNYVYVIETTWSDKSRFELYRKYGDFFSFHDTLLELFPEKAGRTDPAKRSIPYLPTIDRILKIFGRTSSQRVMLSRLVTINHYCKMILLSLGDDIGHSPHVINFFRPTLSDKQCTSSLKRPSLHPLIIPAGDVMEECVLIADYTPDESKADTEQLTAVAGDTVTLIKSDNFGWSLCSKSDKIGWLPTSFLCKKIDEEVEVGDLLLPPDSTSNESINSSSSDGVLVFQAICSYSALELGQVDFPEGALVSVIDKDDDGWWFVQYDGKEGWAPSSYLEPLDKTQSDDELDIVYTPSGTTTGPSFDDAFTETYYARRDYEANLEDELSFKKGDKFVMLNQSYSGWWTVKLGDRIGVVPATYLTEYQSTENGTSEKLSKRFKRTDSKFNRPPPRRQTIRRKKQKL